MVIRRSQTGNAIIRTTCCPVPTEPYFRRSSGKSLHGDLAALVYGALQQLGSPFVLAKNEAKKETNHRLSPTFNGKTSTGSTCLFQGESVHSLRTPFAATTTFTEVVSALFSIRDHRVHRDKRRRTRGIHHTHHTRTMHRIT